MVEIADIIREVFCSVDCEYDRTKYIVLNILKKICFALWKKCLTFVGKSLGLQINSVPFLSDLKV